MHGCLVYAELSPRRQQFQLRGTSHVTAKQHCNHLQIFKNAPCKATLFSESHTHYPVNIPDPIRKHFGSGQLWPLQPAGAAGIGLDRIYILYAGPDFRPHLIRVRSSQDGLDHTVQNKPGYNLVLDGLVRVWPKGSVPEESRCARIIGPASGQHFRAGSVSGSDANRIRHVYWAEGRRREQHYCCHCEALRTHLEMRRSTSVYLNNKIIITTCHTSDAWQF